MPFETNRRHIITHVWWYVHGSYFVRICYDRNYVCYVMCKFEICSCESHMTSVRTHSIVLARWFSSNNQKVLVAFIAFNCFRSFTRCIGGVVTEYKFKYRNTLVHGVGSSFWRLEVRFIEDCMTIFVWTCMTQIQTAILEYVVKTWSCMSHLPVHILEFW